MAVGEYRAGTETYIRGVWCDSYANYRDSNILNLYKNVNVKKYHRYLLEWLLEQDIACGVIPGDMNVAHSLNVAKIQKY